MILAQVARETARDWDVGKQMAMGILAQVEWIGRGRAGMGTAKMVRLVY